MKRIAFISLVSALAMLLCGAGSAVLRAQTLSGVVVSDYRSLNNADGVNVAWNDCDVSESLRTAYICSENGTEGVKVVFGNIYENRLEKGDRVVLNVAGCRKSGRTYTGLKASDVVNRTPGEPLAARVVRASELSEADLYTYVQIDGAEFADKAGAFLNVDERYVQRTVLNESQNPCAAIDSWANMLKCSDGSAVYMILSTRVPWRRDGAGVPAGVGSIKGVVVPAVLPRYGSMHAEYALRPMCREDICIATEPESSYRTVAALRHDNNPGNDARYLYNGLVHADKVCHIMSDRFVMEQGEGQIWMDACVYLRCDRDLDSPVVDKAGERSGGAFRFEGNLHNFFNYDEQDKVVSANGINVSCRTLGLERDGRLFFDFAWCSGNGGAKPSWGYPVNWSVEYSVDGGKSFVSATADKFTPRPIAYQGADVAKYGRCDLSYDAAPGFTQHSVELPAECIGVENLVVRLVPSTDIVSYSGDVTLPLEKRLVEMKRGMMHYIVVRFSSIEINYLGKK